MATDVAEFFKGKNVKVLVQRRGEPTLVECVGTVRQIVPRGYVDIAVGDSPVSDRIFFARVNEGIFEIRSIDNTLLYANPAVPREYKRTLQTPALQFLSARSLVEVLDSYFGPIRNQGVFRTPD